MCACVCMCVCCVYVLCVCVCACAYARASVLIGMCLYLERFLIIAMTVLSSCSIINAISSEI